MRHNFVGNSTFIRNGEAAYAAILGCIIVVCLPTSLAAGADDSVPTCSLTLELADSDSENALPGLVQLRDGEGKPVHLAELLDRGLGLPDEEAIHDWFVLPESTVVTVPQGKFTVRGFSGLETEIAEAEIDLTNKDAALCRLSLIRFYPARKDGWQAANTHVHLKKTSKAQTERYLIQCSQADGLDIVFVSYLERPSDHVHYSTNNYTRDQLRALSNRHTRFDHGEEHRHNFTAWDEGYGHVMLLNIPELIKPVSIGPGITDKGTDGTPLRVGIDKARSYAGRIIWCHNTFGLEDIPNWLAGRLDANNIFDGGTHGSYQHSFYRYLNIGLRVPFSSGTDWFIYDFSRVYVKNEARLSPEVWLEHLSNARSYITNGPLLEFLVADKTLGDDVSLSEPGNVRVTGRAVGRVDFGRLELVKNGQVIRQVNCQAIDGHFRAEINLEVPIDAPAWLALRTPPPSAPKMGLIEKTPINEYGHEIFSHTSAIFVDVGGKRIFDPVVAEDLVSEMERNRDFIGGRGSFDNPIEQQRVLHVYDGAIEKLRTQIGR